jgi:hypothetical protein
MLTGVSWPWRCHFFFHHGHQVFHDPCLDLDKYPWAMSVSLPIILVDCLPDHILLSGLELMEALFTNSFGTAFMAAYLKSHPSPRSVPLGGLAAPPGISGDRLVAPGGIPAGSMLLPTRGHWCQHGGFSVQHGGFRCPRGDACIEYGGLGRWPDPDKGVSAPPRPQRRSLLPSLNRVHLPSYHSPTLGTSSGSGIPPPLVAFDGIVGAPFSVLHPLSRSTNQIPMRRGQPPLAPVVAPCSHPWFYGPVIRRNAQGRSLPLMDIRGGAPHPHPLAAMTVLGGFLLPLPPAPLASPHRRRIIGVLAVLSAMNLIGPPPHQVTFCSPPSPSLWISSPSLPSSLAKITSSQGTSFSTGFEPLVFPLPTRICSW